MRARQGLLVVGLALAGCREAGAPATVQEAKVEAAPKKEPTKAAEPGPQPQAQTGPTLARVREDVALPLTGLLGQPPPAVEAKLGPPPGKGMMRSTCVRYVPERVFFGCGYAVQRYADPTGTFAGVEVEYEDGVATGLGFDGWTRGSGPVEPGPLLAAIGLELPEAPAVETPAEGVRRWTWFNHRARLRIAGRQYRVEMSAVGDDWARSRISVILNEPLTAAQKAKIVPPAQPSG